MKQREKIIECAEGIIGQLEKIIMMRVTEDWNDELDIDEAIEIANKVYNQIKLRM